MMRLALLSTLALSSVLLLSTPRKGLAQTESAPSTSADPSSAEQAPGWYTHRDDESTQGDLRTVVGRVMATPERATNDAKEHLRRSLQEWLAASGVPRSWTPPSGWADRLVLETHVDSQTRSYGTVHMAALRVDYSPQRRAQFVNEYERQLVGRRLGLLAGAFAFLLTCLAGVAGYIRADEATKGYYTNRLRLASAVGVGAAGMAIYRMLV